MKGRIWQIKDDDVTTISEDHESELVVRYPIRVWARSTVAKERWALDASIRRSFALGL